MKRTVKIAISAVMVAVLVPIFLATPQSEEQQTIKIASWNIQNFGAKKAGDDDIMRAIANMIQNYDIIAVQEISNVKEMSDQGCPKNENKCPDGKGCNLLRNALEKYLNEELGLNYEFKFSPQVKDERYLYIFNPDKVTPLDDFELVDDAGDSKPICVAKKTGKMDRQPFKATFRAGDFDFVLLTVHTAPDKNIKELKGLADFYAKVESEGEPDVIILGDLNADCDYLPKSKRDSIPLRKDGFIWHIKDGGDTTVAKNKCAYDRFVFKEPTSEDFVTADVNRNVTKAVSDHYLIWAEFSTSSDTD